jgi:hypothetical protein
MISVVFRSTLKGDLIKFTILININAEIIVPAGGK